MRDDVALRRDFRDDAKVDEGREKKRTPPLLAAALMLLLFFAACQSAPTPTATPTAIPTSTPTPTATPASTPTPSPTPTPTAVPAPFRPAAPLAIPTPTPAPDPTVTSTPTPTATPLPSPTPTATATPTASPTPSPTPTARERRIRDAEWADSIDRGILRNLAQEEPHAVDVFLDWIGDGKQRGESSRFILGGYSDLANANGPVAVRVLRMPFLEEVAYPDSEVLITLRDVARSDPEGLILLLDHPSLEGGIADEHTGAFFLLHLERKSPTAAETIRMFAWVQDGLTLGSWGETEAVIKLVQTALAFPGTFQSLQWHAWLRDGITRPENGVLNSIALVHATPFNDEEIKPLIGMPFLQTVDETDASLIQVLLETLGLSPYGVRDIIARTELLGGITDAQRSTVALMVLDLYDQEDAERMRSLAWLRDGIQPVEDYTFWTLWDMARGSETGRVFQLLMNEPWIRDDVTPTESGVVDGLLGLYYASGDADALAQALNMPFLDSIEPEDVNTLRELRP